MAERSRKRQTKRYKDVMTQTSPENYVTENDRLRDEISLLRREVDHLKRKHQLDSTSRRQQDEVIVVAVADSPQPENITIKGCNCRGKCSSRVCGCVKKQIGCTAACKCLDSKCQNQESNKENIDNPNTAAQLSSKVEENTKLLGTLNLRKSRREKNAQRAAGPSDERLGQVEKSGKSIFSPDTPLSHRQNKIIKEKRKVEMVGKVEEISVETAANSNENSPDMEVQSEFATIDPMKPTRQLQRTPVSASSCEKPARLSDVPLRGLLPVKMEPRILIPPPKDIDSPQVDWEEHCAQLVRCRLCKRTFYPYRLEKHEASCKKI